MRLLLGTDLDRTLLPNGPQPESPGAREAFARLAAHPDLTLVYVTGRDPTLVDEAIAQFGLPAPDALIADVGATIAVREDGGWRRSAAWDGKLAADWRGRNGPELAAQLEDIEGLRLQEPSRQGRFKLSYYAPSGARDLAGTVEERLRERGFRCSVIWSIDEATDDGLLDVLPAGADKAQALSHLASERGFAPDEVLFAGDSGNDLQVMASGLPSVLVANAAEEVRDEALRLADANGSRNLLHLARGGPMGWNGNYAAGILEGVLHFHPGWAAVIENHEPESGN